MFKFFGLYQLKMAEAIAALVETTSTSEPLGEVDGAIADPETVVTEVSTKIWRDDLTLTVENRQPKRSSASSSVDSRENEFCTKTSRTDMALIVEEQQLHVAKTVLALASPVFEAMFDGEFKESNKDKLTLPGKKYADVLEFLRCIYPNVMKPVTLENVYEVLPLADEYQVEWLKAACEACFLGHLSKDIKADILYKILTKARLFNMLRVTERGIDIAAERPHTEIDNADNKLTLSEDIKGDIRVRMLQNMNTKYNDICKQIVTSKAVCKYLGTAGKQKYLAQQYLEGRVVGDFGSLSLRSPYNVKSLYLKIDGISFTVNVDKEEDLNVCIQRNRPGKYDINCFLVVVVNNWMKDKEDIIKKEKLHFGSSDTSLQWMSEEIYSDTIVDQTAGFMFEQAINIDVFLFSIQKHL